MFNFVPIKIVAITAVALFSSFKNSDFKLGKIANYLKKELSSYPILRLKYFTLLSILVSSLSYAQVGINTTSPEGGAMLDVNSVDKGVLLPKLNIIDLATIAPVTGGAPVGLLAYNTNTTSGPGYFYWDGSEWVTITNVNDDWKLDGNALTNPGVGVSQNYVGTSDNNNLVVATNKIEALRITTSQRLQSGNNGTDVSPVYSFVDDVNTGIFRSTDDAFNISAGGVEMVEFQKGASDGQVTFNDTDLDIDFRIATDDQENMLFVDGGEDQVFIRNNAHHISSYIDPFNSYANAINDGTATTGIQYAIAGWNQGTLGGGINGVIEDNTNPYASIEGATSGPGIAVRGLSVTNSNAIGTLGFRPYTDPMDPTIIGADLGFGGVFLGGLAYQGGVYNISDERIKKDIHTIEGSLEKIMNLEGVSFKYDYAKFSKNPLFDPNTYYGFIAQNVKKQLPHAVKEKNVVVSQPDNRTITEKEILNVVDYTSVIPVLVEAMKEQQKMINQQNDKINKLEAQINQLKK